MRSILLVPFLLLAAPALAQQEDSQIWFQANGQVPLDDNLRLTLEGIMRWSDRQDGLFHTEIGGIVSTKIADNVEIGFGYRHVGAHGGSTADDEDRLRQHIVVTLGRFTTRLRVDERFHPDGDEIGFRIRPLVRYSHPVGSKGYALFAVHESFFMANDTDWGQRAGYDRVRHTLGVTVPMAKGISADIGYLNQYRFARNGGRAQMDHAFSYQITLALGGGKKPKPEEE
ncbi:DUF2490 domain-containing protein [Sphingomonas turrisvirgatae]|uniref:DUF2490 domain-containing protein n=1 Tax=Sphingomonas turrisvirgatae TaxID=1888892 RepID=A0A1E3LWC5_9SPHN|nr:DUF2490 domain-containing protein [Sphingomonas turrisvirgatae]ODP38072.1 hypothetical protein BFL28_15720 [Sphingomonas turrisvirgatae]